ncbi:hypothetical protein [uncultured Ruminococcus sp.]|uniref:hypothetical protein n=1 Tax=uncultured Ruminococcus sp. TaxID=165186 RepID=UPI0025FC0BD0|nr:hypothetical protein [uncultured Ruminococcus sp.]
MEEVNEGVKVTEEISNTIIKIKYNQRYYKYASGVSINTFAYKIAPANKEKFITFLSQNAFDVKSQLFENFKEKKKEIKTKGLFEDLESCFSDIANTFSEIIDDAEEAYKSSPRNLSWKERKSIGTKSIKNKITKNVSEDDNSVPISSISGEQVEPVTKTEPVINSYIRELKDSVDSLIEYGYCTYELQVTCFGSNNARNMENKLDKQFKHLWELYRKISNYNKIHHIDILVKILSTIRMIEKEDFVASRESFMIHTVKNHKIHTLLKLIRIFSKENDIK